MLIHVGLGFHLGPTCEICIMLQCFAFFFFILFDVETSEVRVSFWVLFVGFVTKKDELTYDIGGGSKHAWY